jgi:hypothetical protein
MTPRTVSSESQTPQTTSRQTVEDKLDDILAYMHRFERRDRIRTFNATMHALFSIVPMLMFIYGSWYLYAHGAELMKTLSEQAARSAAEYSQDSMSNFIQQFAPKR